MGKYIGIKYEIDGIYGEVKHCKMISEADFDMTFEKYIASLNYSNQPDVKFNVCIKTEDGIILFKKYDIEGLPSYLNIDMGTYFRMAQLREMKDNKQLFVIDNFRSKGSSLEEIAEKVMQKMLNDLKISGIQK